MKRIIVTLMVTTLQDAKIEIKNVLTDYIKDIEVIEVFDVKDELSKINII